MPKNQYLRIMATYRTHGQTDHIYFCTFTCIGWIPLFEMVHLYGSIYHWLKLLRKAGNHIIGFVIMPNHLHVLLHFRQQTGSINSILANGKRFLAYEIVKRLTQNGHHDVLEKLSSRVTPKERARKKKHRVFEPSSDIKPCYTEKFLLQKLNYIHHNPLNGKWNLVDDFTMYAHSTACFYEHGVVHPHVEITHYKDISFSRIVPEAGDDTGQ
jgi:REP element-mobilizing transposase RayT